MKKIILFCLIIYVESFAQSGYTIELKKIYCDWTDQVSFVDSVETVIRNNGITQPPANYYYEYHAITEHADGRAEQIYGDWGLNKFFRDNDLNFVQTWYVIVKNQSNQTIGISDSVIFQMETTPNQKAKQIHFQALKSNGTNESGVHAEHWMYVVDLWDPIFKSYVTVNHDEVLKSSPSFLTNNNDKFNYWNTDQSDMLNHNHFYYTNMTTENLIANYKTAHGGVTLQVNTDAGDTIEFKDPWLVDLNESPYGMRNQGIGAPFIKRHSPFNPSLDPPYRGVLLNQDYNVPGQPYYSISIPSSVTVGGQAHSIILRNWDLTNAQLQSPTQLTTGVVFTNNPASVTANLKGHLLSNASTGLSTNSQRKIVADSFNYLHMVYESMGSIWYCRSTNGGSTWTDEQKVNAEGSNAKCPSIACSNDGNDLIYIVYQSDVDEISWEQPSILLSQYRLGSFRWRYLVNNISSYSYNTNPVITALNGLAFVLYKPTSSSQLTGKEFAINGSYNVSSVYNRGNVPGTDANSINPSLTVYGISGGKYYLAYQQGTTAVKYFGWGINSAYSSQESYTVSSGSAGTTALYPSISQNAGNIIVSWTGNVPYRTTCFIRRRPYGGSWSSFQQVGSFMNYTNNNTKSGATEDAIIGWWDTYAHITQFVKLTSGVFGTITTLPSQGLFNISNGSSFNTMKAVLFYSGGSAPYVVNPLTYDFYYLQKQNVNKNLVYGREAVISIGETEIAYCLEDIKLENENILFKEFDTKATVNSTEDLNSIIQTQKFQLNKESKLQFSTIYYAFRSDISSEIKEKCNFNFQVELVSADKNNPIGAFRNLKIDKNSINDSGRISYALDCTNIKGGEYYLRVVMKNPGQIKVDCNISDIQYEKTNGLPKTNVQEISSTGEKTVVNYGLLQNYPNPFNPTTEINFEIPKSGMVTLKVYDMLGKEISVLVNEFKNEGNYTVKFDGSNLSSGIYLYELRVNEHTFSKKMLLMK